MVHLDIGRCRQLFLTEMVTLHRALLPPAPRGFESRDHLEGQADGHGLFGGLAGLALMAGAMCFSQTLRTSSRLPGCVLCLMINANGFLAILLVMVQTLIQPACAAWMVPYSSFGYQSVPRPSGVMSRLGHNQQPDEHGRCDQTEHGADSMQLTPLDKQTTGFR